MKSTKFLLAFAICLGVFFAVPALAKERIDSFDAKIQINADATINITETIKYNFGAEERHGIYRDIPIKYTRDGNNFNLRISDISITDGKGLPYNYEISYPGDNIDIKIGDANILITGVKTYVINYKINRAINYFADHDELYWNVTGNGWDAPINNSSATILLPQNLKTTDLNAACYEGVYGDPASCLGYVFILDSNDKTKASGVKFNQGELNPYEGLTFVFGWPSGLVAKPTIQENTLSFLEDNKGIFLFIFTIIGCYLFWIFKGKDPAGRGTIIAEYDAPDGLSPAEVGTIVDEKTEKKDISAEIINLAVTGCLKIKREEAGKFFKHAEYTLIKLKDAPANSPKHATELMTALFGNDSEIKLSDLKEEFYSDYKRITANIYEQTAKDGYFPKNPQTMRVGFMITALLLAFFIYLITGSLSATFGIVSFVISAIIIILFSQIMSRKTSKGVLAKEQILGLKEYLSVAEKDRLKFHNAPEKNPELFEKLLPYAMVLGVETQWAGQFKDIYKQQPNWYVSDQSAANFNSLALIISLNTFTASANSSLYAAPSSASSGSSGFSSGGSGGGFGGGGGGSW